MAPKKEPQATKTTKKQDRPIKKASTPKAAPKTAKKGKENEEPKVKPVKKQVKTADEKPKELTSPKKSQKPENVEASAPTKPQKTKQSVQSSKPNKKEKAKKHQPSKKPKGPKKEGKARKAQKPVKSATRKAWETTKRELLYHFRQHWFLVVATTSVIMLLLALYFAVDKLDSQRTPPVTDKVSIRFAIDGKDIGSVQFGLFGSTCPMTTKNFIMLATHEKGYGYIGSRIHMVIPMHLMVGGDITKGDGTGGRSALEQPFENENFKVHHTGPGYLGMLSLENNRNSSRTSIFYVTINAMPRLDRNSVAFGKVLDGMEVIKQIEAVEVDKDMVPLTNVTITDASHSPA